MCFVWKEDKHFLQFFNYKHSFINLETRSNGTCNEFTAHITVANHTSNTAMIAKDCAWWTTSCALVNIFPDYT